MGFINFNAQCSFEKKRRSKRYARSLLASWFNSIKGEVASAAFALTGHFIFIWKLKKAEINIVSWATRLQTTTNSVWIQVDQKYELCKEVVHPNFFLAGSFSLKILKHMIARSSTNSKISASTDNRLYKKIVFLCSIIK